MDNTPYTKEEIEIRRKEVERWQSIQRKQRKAELMKKLPSVVAQAKEVEPLYNLIRKKHAKKLKEVAKSFTFSSLLHLYTFDKNTLKILHDLEVISKHEYFKTNFVNDDNETNWRTFANLSGDISVVKSSTDNATNLIFAFAHFHMSNVLDLIPTDEEKEKFLSWHKTRLEEEKEKIEKSIKRGYSIFELDLIKEILLG